jgi:bifunctional non-homologous end joining protein LigD
MLSTASVPDRLDRYRAKRDPARTPEPFGTAWSAPAGEARLFVVQKHAARRLHWDFRLELGGTLRSWAVPRGPSADPAEKRMAVEVEDHPIEYAEFEGVIPAGNYGAGAVVVWDRGVWRVAGDPEEGLRKGKLVFTLEGYKLRGEWTLVRTKGKEGGKPGWLLLKHRGDPWAGPGRPFPEQSVLSGRTVEEVAAGISRAEAVLSEARRLGARPIAGRFEAGPMLAGSAERPFDDPGWLFELKYDGYRMSAERRGHDVSLAYRSGQGATALYPEVARAVAALPCDARLDGEVVVLQPDGRPSFQALQGRARLSRPEEVARAAVARPATLLAFDLLAVGGLDARPLANADRKRLLERLVPKLGPLRYADHVEGRGVALHRKVRELGLEGIVAKRADAPYRAGRSSAWLKIRVERSGDFAVVGFTAPRGGRAGFGALHLAVHDGRSLVYAGSVGSGFDEGSLRAIHARLSGRARATPPCTGPLPRGRGHTWVEPELVCQVTFREWTDDGLLRHPVFERLRDDKRPEEAVREGGEPAAPPAPPPVESARQVEVTHPDKVFFPGEGITKGDLVAYHRAIAPFMLPYLRDRPLVLTRYPDGIEGKSFFQKDAPSWAPSWLRTVRIRGQEGERELDHFLVDDADGLAWIANTGTIPIHVWSSRVPPRGGGGSAETPSLDRPDWCIVDLDPKGAPFAQVVALARAVHALCRELGLPSHCKTTGQDGLHVLVPLGGQLTHAQARTLAELLARAVESEHPDIATTARAIGARGGKVYLDYLQNGLGKTIAAPYAVRPRPGAPVSTPLRWSEVNGRLDPSGFTVRNVVRRAERLGDDPLRAVLEERPDLLVALARLKERLEGGRGPRRRGPSARRR